MEYESQIVNDKEDKEERWFNSCIWFVLVFVCGLSFLFIVYKNIQEVALKVNGNKFTTTYMESRKSVLYVAENGNTYTLPIMEMYPSHRGDEIDLYYYGDDKIMAKPLTKIEFWVVMEGVLGGFTAIFLWRAVRNFRRIQHYKESSER